MIETLNNELQEQQEHNNRLQELLDRLLERLAATEAGAVEPAATEDKEDEVEQTEEGEDGKIAEPAGGDSELAE